MARVLVTSAPARSAAGLRRTGWAAFAGYLIVSALFFGPRVVAHPGRMHIGGLFTDPQIFVWAFAWWPHAILHGENPFYTHAIWAPNGFNLAWATSVPALAIAFAPFTLAFGPVVSYNIACIVMPAVAAWAGFLLCRHLTRALWPSLAGGYLFGFSSYILSAELSHINTVAVFVLPLGALVILRHLEGSLGNRGLILMLGGLIALQLYLWTELVFTLTLALACSLVLGYLLVSDLRERLLASVAPIVGAYAFAAVLAAPLLYFVVTGLDSRPGPTAGPFVADALNFVIPTRASLFGWWGAHLARHFPANDIERGAYLGLPTLLIAGWFAARRWWTPTGRFLLASLAVAGVASLGSWLTVDGRRLFALPWLHIAALPLIDNVMPVRLTVFTALTSAVIVALWASSKLATPWLRAVLPGLAIVAVLPNLSWSAWARAPDVPVLFTTDAYRGCLRQGENIITFPVGPRGDSMIWQADSKFWFRMAGAYISPSVPDSFTHPAGIVHLTTADNPSEVTIGAVLELARLKGATSIVVDARQGATWRPVLRSLGPPQEVGGALIYRLPGNHEPPCTSTSQTVEAPAR